MLSGSRSYVVMAFTGMAFTGMAFIGMAYIVMAYIVMAYIPQRPRVWENNQFVLKIRRTTQALGILLFSIEKSTIFRARQWAAEI